MAGNNTITASNAIFMLAVAGLFPVPQLLQGYSADAAFETDTSEPAEVMMGVDGVMSVGFVPFVTRQTISLQADSASADMFEAWLQAEKAAREKYFANGVITLPSVGKSYILTRGALTSIVPIPGTRKVLQPRAFVLSWQDISPTPI